VVYNLVDGEKIVVTYLRLIRLQGLGRNKKISVRIDTEPFEWGRVGMGNCPSIFCKNNVNFIERD
jgi:hypothetical protein